MASVILISIHFMQEGKRDKEAENINKESEWANWAQNSLANELTTKVSPISRARPPRDAAACVKLFRRKIHVIIIIIVMSSSEIKKEDVKTVNVSRLLSSHDPKQLFYWVTQCERRGRRGFCWRRYVFSVYLFRRGVVMCLLGTCANIHNVTATKFLVG